MRLHVLARFCKLAHAHAPWLQLTCKQKRDAARQPEMNELRTHAHARAHQGSYWGSGECLGCPRPSAQNLGVPAASGELKGS